MVATLHLDSKCPACVDVVIGCWMFAEHFESAVVEALPATSLVWDSFADEVTFAALDSFVEIIVGKAPDIEDYFRVVVWQVLASN